ncbi:MAG TPA: hypothetical protein VFD82_21420 [Planctomycetota bacterium]|nr:hypothetical protein [Planctomycetota bacterium]
MKRFFAFLLLLGIGIALLLLAIGDEEAVRANGPRTNDAEPTRPPDTGVEVTQGRVGATVSQTGYLELHNYRTIPLPDGRERKEETYVLKARNSQPIEAGRQQLDGVEVQLFEDGKHAANLLARQAFVELGRDANGKPELQRDKDVDLRDAVFVTLEDSKMPGLRLDLGDARVRVGDSEMQIETAADQPVQLVVGGDRDGEAQRKPDGPRVDKPRARTSGTLRGKGLVASLPRDQSGAMQRADIKILRDPVLETRGAVVQALGSMHYVEDVQSGTAQITLSGGVQLDLQRGVSMSGLGSVRAAHADGGGMLSNIRGDNFTGWLLRGKQIVDGRDRNELVWRRLQVTGAPASVDVDAGRLSTPKITVLPGLFGEAFLVTAHGGESRVEQTTPRKGSKQKDLFTGVSPDRIHLVRPADLVGPLHRAFGFPEWTLGPLNKLRVVAFDGGSRIESASGTLVASKGVQAFGTEGSGHAIARGFGAVRIVQRATKRGEADLVANGNDGFWLRTTSDSELLRLGPTPDFADPTAPWRSHRYDLQQGDMQVHGQGTARIERQFDPSGERRDERTRLWLRAPAAEISGRLTKNGMDLTGVRQLEATIENKVVQALDVAGLPVRTTVVRTAETVHAEAPRVLQIGPQSLRLLGASGPDASSLWGDLPAPNALPSLDVAVAPRRAPGKRFALTGPWIDVHHLGSSAVFVDATAQGDLRPTVNATFENKDGRAPTTASFDAARLRLLPFAVTKEAQQVHTGATSSVLADLAFHALGKPWVIVDEVRNFRLQDEQHGLIEGHGTRMLLSEGAEAGVFLGDPDLGTPAEVRRTDQGRVITTSGARVRVFREDDVRLQALRTFDGRPTVLLPTVTWHEPGEKGPLSHLRAVCRGDIEVLPESIVCRGPVEAQGLREDGSDDPDGVHFDAETLTMETMERQGKKEIVRTLCKGVTASWSGMTAKSASLELDVKFSRLIARDPKGAVVALPNGRTLTAPRIEVNYETWSFDLSNGGFAQKNPTQGPGR